MKFQLKIYILKYQKPGKGKKSTFSNENEGSTLFRKKNIKTNNNICIQYFYFLQHCYMSNS